MTIKKRMMTIGPPMESIRLRTTVSGCYGRWRLESDSLGDQNEDLSPVPSELLVGSFRGRGRTSWVFSSYTDTDGASGDSPSSSVELRKEQNDNMKLTASRRVRQGLKQESARCLPEEVSATHSSQQLQLPRYLQSR